MTDSSDDTMGSRIEESTLKFWILTQMDRRVLAAGLSVAVFFLLVVLSIVGPAPMRRVIETSDALWWVFSPMITAIITIVALVVTFNQLVLSQELGALGDQRDRMQGSMDFRESAEPWLDARVAPPDPASFLAALLGSIQNVATELEAAVNDGTDEETEQIREFAAEISESAREVQNRLEDAQFGTFDVVDASLNFNYSENIYEARRLIAHHEAILDEEATDALEDIITVLEFYGPTREHIKTLYFQWELVNISRIMLYAAIPALVVALGMLLYVDTTAVTGATFTVDNIVWLVCAAAIITLSPFFLLFSYVLRIASVTKRTLAIGPFVLRDRD